MRSVAASVLTARTTPLPFQAITVARKTEPGGQNQISIGRYTRFLFECTLEQPTNKGTLKLPVLFPANQPLAGEHLPIGLKHVSRLPSPFLK